MDMICVDLLSQPQARVGDAVRPWGLTMPVDEIATCANTIHYDLSCRFTSRGRVYAQWRLCVLAPLTRAAREWRFNPPHGNAG